MAEAQMAMAESRKQRKRAQPPPVSERFTIIVIGLIALAIVIFLIWRAFEQPFLLKTKITNGDGIRPGAEVRLAGAKVGSVRRIRLLGVPANKENNDQIVELTLSIDDKIGTNSPGEMIHQDAVAVLISTGTLGERTIDIIPGKPTAPATKSGDYIASQVEASIGTLINRNQTVRANFDRVRSILDNLSDQVKRGEGTIGRFQGNEFDNSLRRVEAQTEALDRLIDKGNGSVSLFRRDQRLHDSYLRLQQLTEQLRKNFAEGRGNAGRFIQDKQFSQRIEQVEARARRLADQFERIYGRTEKGNGSLAKLTNDLQFKRDYQQFNTHINTISTLLEKRQGSMGLLLHDGRLANNIGSISTEMLKLVYDFRQKPTKYVKFTIF
ncbi:MAG: MlaD family protein [Acidobacteriota bacterium]